LVKYSIATTANLKLPWAVGSGQTISIPQHCNGQVGVAVMEHQAFADALLRTGKLCKS
jgi:hypothetical protein